MGFFYKMTDRLAATDSLRTGYLVSLDYYNYIMARAAYIIDTRLDGQTDTCGCEGVLQPTYVEGEPMATETILPRPHPGGELGLMATGDKGHATSDKRIHAPRSKGDTAKPYAKGNPAGDLVKVWPPQWVHSDGAGAHLYGIFPQPGFRRGWE